MTSQKVINPTKCPKAARFIQIHRSSQDGWMLLHQLLCNRSDHLRGSSNDLNLAITTLKIKQGEDIHAFYARVIDLENQLPFTRQHIDSTLLTNRYLQAMAQSTSHFSLIQHFLSDMAIHIQ